MSNPPPAALAPVPLTAAQKRKNTLAAKAEQERRDQAVAEAESRKNPGGRKAKVDANKNADWQTAQAAEVIKKARSAKDTADQPRPAAKKNKAASTFGRKYAAASIDDSDDSASKAISKTSTKVIAVVTKGLKALAGVKSRAAKVGKAAGRKPRVIAESASEDEEAVSSEEIPADAPSDQSEDEGIHDVSPNEDEFEIEVPHIVSAQSKSANDEDDHTSDVEQMKGDRSSAHELFDSDNESIKIDKPRIKGKGRARRQSEEVMNSENESIEIDKPRVKSKGKARRQDPDTDSFHDAPPAADTEMHAAKSVKSGFTTRSGRSSAVSWSSGQDLHVPDSDAEEDLLAHVTVALPSKKVRKVSAARQKQAELESDFSTRSGRSSAVSWSSSQDLHVPDSDAEEDLPAHVTVAPPSKKVRKVSAARQKQAELERPEVRPAPVAAGKMAQGLHGQLDRIAAAAVDAASRPESEWHVSAQLMFPAPGKDIGLTSQSEELKVVLRGAIEFIKLSLLFEDAYPAIVSRAGFARSYLISAAQAPTLVHIKQRLEADLSFGARLADIPLDRINIMRGDLKRIAAQEVPGLYRFAHLPAAEVRVIVTECLQDRYIFPVDPATSRLKAELPFHHDAVVNVIKKGVFTGQFRTKNLHLFASTNAKHPERSELPDAMICLATTAVYGVLVQYRATGNLQNIPFTEGAYEDVYRNHMKTLSDTRAAAPVATHRVLHKLFNLVSESTGTVASASGSSSVLINLVEVPDSD